eukprot:1946157-Heterocapsa_arctica.AAC.1
MEIDTEDVEVLKSLLAEKTVGFDHLENLINSLRAENAAQLVIVESLEVARVASDAQSIVQRENVI